MKVFCRRRMLTGMALLVCGTAVANPVQISFSASVVEVFEDNGTTPFSGTLPGSALNASIVYDDEPGATVSCDPDACEWSWPNAPYGGSVVQGNVAGLSSALIIEDDRTVDDPADLAVINAVVEPDITLGTAFDLWEVSVDAALPDGLAYFSFTTLTLDTTLQPDTDFVALPPTATADAVAMVIEAQTATGMFSAIAVVTGYEIIPLIADSDEDGTPDSHDNCRFTANPTQLDSNGDLIGNACDADLNGDCLVNFGDLALLKSSFQPNPYNAHADFNGDGFVNFGDLAFLKSTFFNGANPGPGPGAPGNACD